EQTLDALTYMRGEPRWYFSVVRPVADETGRAETALVIGTDVSQIRHAEVALKEERDFIRSLLDTATSLIVSLDKNACITEFNPECERVTGYKREEVLGKHWPTLFLPDDLQAEAPDDFLRWVREHPRGMYEGRILTRGGAERDILWSTSAIIPEDSDDITALAVGQDITDRKHAEQALRESEERYRLLVDNVRAGIALVDHDGQFLFINEVGAQAHGKPIDEIIGKTMYQLFPAEIADYQMQNVRTVIDSGREFKEEAPTKIGDQWRWYFTNVQPFRNPEGETTAAMVIAHDVTDTKKAQIALKEERDFVRSLLDTANSLILCLDSDARITVFNDECERVTGFKRDEVMGKRWPEVFLPSEAQHEGLDDFVTWVKSHPRDSYEGPLRVRNGDTRTILWSNSALISDDGEKVTALAVGQDITDRKRAEQEVRESEERLRHLAEATPIPLSITGFPEGDILYYNQPMLDMFAITEDQVPEINIASFYVDLADRRALHDAVIANGSVRNYEIQGTDYHGVGFWVTISSQRTVYKGRQALVTGYYDVTERKRSENALRYRVDFEKLITSISTRFINIPSERIESEVNTSLWEILDFTRSDLVSARLFSPDQDGRRFALAAREEHRELVERNSRVAVSENAWLRTALVEDGGLRINSLDHARVLAPQAVTVMNELHTQSVLVVPIIYRHRLIGSLGLAQVDRNREWTDDEFALIKIVAEILANVFEHQRFEQELVKATRAKYDQVREIAGGVSHEIHNALFPATSGLEKLRQRLPDIEDPEHKRNRALLNLVDQSVSRAMSMTRLVTTLSRLEGEKRVEQVWLSPLLESVVQANQGPLEEYRIDLTLEVPDDMAWSCSGEHAFSVCNNLVMNAIDALSEIDSKRTLSIRAVRDDGGIRLTIRDNGPGIPTENLSRIFDAFFSTKPRTGSGLGLAVVKRVLELYGGDIDVRSRLDSGTEFVIFCPEYSP
ncbi:PAS domain S-box protein, partial [candidate division GN15 bacterium]|nr:PAS domain S-box protein [candidate division GN15 bacterium]